MFCCLQRRRANRAVQRSGFKILHHSPFSLGNQMVAGMPTFQSAFVCIGCYRDSNVSHQLMRCAGVKAKQVIGDKTVVVCNEGMLLDGQRIRMLLRQAHKSCPAVNRMTRGRTAAPFCPMQHQGNFSSSLNRHGTVGSHLFARLSVRGSLQAPGGARAPGIFHDPDCCGGRPLSHAHTCQDTHFVMSPSSRAA